MKSALIALGLLCTFSAHADDDVFKFSGFGSIIGGKILSGSKTDPYSPNPGLTPCPCYIVDWTNAGVYGPGFSFKPESHVGVQMNAAVTSDLSFVGQLVSRGTEPHPDVQWAYGAYKVDKNWEVQFGRKRIPIYYYSDYQDIGLAYPWVNVPSEIYGWEATNYNGVSVRYRNTIKDWSVIASMFRGGETVHKSRYQMLITPNQTTVKWSGLAGADLELSKDWFTTRLIYFQSRNNYTDMVTGIDSPMNQRAYGIAVNLDFDRWFFLSEFTSNDRAYLSPGYQINTRQPASSIGAGYRLGKWTLFGNWSMYHDYEVGGPDKSLWAQSGWRHKLVNLRYDLTSKSDIKIQYDDYHDLSVPFWSPGHSKTLRVSYDFVF